MITTDLEEYTSILDVGVTKEWLFQQLRADPKEITILDCRSTNEYGESHIRDAVNFSIPSIMLRRLAAGKIDLVSTIKCQELREKIVEAYARGVFVIYGEDNINDFDKNSSTSEVQLVLLKRLLQDGCRVVWLQDGFTAFRGSYPEWCESSVETSAPGSDPVAAPLMGLRSLRISASPPTSHRHRYRLAGSSCESSIAGSSTDSSDSDDRCDSSLGLEDDRDFPVEILPNLYLGNAANSQDRESLKKHGIEYVLNVTQDLPNVFEDCGKMKYMQIPISDHWSQDVASFFPKAIKFIDEGRDNSKGVLVHCLAGVSRSVTITVAYLMYKLNLSLNDAFNLVKDRKSNIAPNFHFLEQLHNFEQELKSEGKLPGWKESGVEKPEEKEEVKSTPEAETSKSTKCTKCDSSSECKCKPSQFLSPLVVGASPDSGIEFDRWAHPPAPGE